MLQKTEKKLYFTSSMYNRAFILNYCLKQLKKDNKSMQVITSNKDDKTKIIFRFKDGFNEKKSFIAQGCCSWSALYSGFIVDQSYYYFQLDDNCFFEGLFQRIILDNEYNYTGARYCYTEIDLFKNNESLQQAVKINYFNNFDAWRTYSNKTLLKYARIYYKEYFLKYFLNIRNSEIVYEKKRICNYYSTGCHYENIYDKRKYNIFKKH